MSSFFLPAQSPGYRADIDGLRAIAVLSVVLFHVNSAWLPGGFAGVDIFFVISGYLITGNILRETASPQGFSFIEFYRRRVLRIIPVLALVVLVTLLAGQFILLPDDLLELGASALAAAFSAANIYFTYFLDTSYFADDSSLQPLLHLWSLGVEEQFYLFWPIILLLLSRAPRVVLVSFVLIVIVLSFYLAEYLLGRSPMFAYYMLPTRAGELLLGGLAAIWQNSYRGKLSATLCNGLALAGGALIVYSLIWIHEDEGFPGVNALFSTLGAMLVITSGTQGLHSVSRVLAFPPLVFIGLLSYSLYLWHWPLLAYYRYAFGWVETGAGLTILLVMFGLSYLSYRWVEKPFRALRWSFTKVSLVIVGGSTVILLVLCGALFLTKGFGLYLYDKDYRSALSAEQPSPPAYSYPYVCQRPMIRAADIANELCIINGKKEPDILLWGDSNAGHYVGMVGAIAEREGFSFRNIAHSSCPPVLVDVDKMVIPERAQDCLASLHLVGKHLDHYSTLILGAAWGNYFSRNPDFGRVVTEAVQGFAGQGKRVIILGQIPALGGVDRKCAQKALKIPLSCRGQGVAQDDGDSQANLFMASLAANTPGVEYFDPRTYMCSDGLCSAYIGDKFIYYDRSHLSMDGSWLIGHKVVQRGTPGSFLGLQGSDLSSLGGKSLQYWLLDRGRERFLVNDTDWVALLSPASRRGWSGNATTGNQSGNQSELEGYFIEDSSAEKFAMFNYSFTPSDYISASGVEPALIARVEISACLSDYPMIRFWLQGDQTRKFDVILDCGAGKVKVKGAIGRQDAYAERTESGYMVYIYLPLAGSFDKAKFTLYPASGLKFGAYSEAAMGRVAVRNFHIAPAPIL